MADIQEQINQILSNPEALRQVQVLGEQLGLTKGQPQSNSEPEPKPAAAQQSNVPGNAMNGDMLRVMTRLAPLMQSANRDDDTARLLGALRPFLSEEKQIKLSKAEKMLKIIKILPLLRDNGLF
ncbi:MAG: hypothetical protein LUF33_06230 [Clostridiales bacterium]|nr:hypothetical protein [Clostridiales bacterium]